MLPAWTFGQFEFTEAMAAAQLQRVRDLKASFRAEPMTGAELHDLHDRPRDLFWERGLITLADWAAVVQTAKDDKNGAVTLTFTNSSATIEIDPDFEIKKPGAAEGTLDYAFQPGAAAALPEPLLGVRMRWKKTHLPGEQAFGKKILRSVSGSVAKKMEVLNKWKSAAQVIAKLNEQSVKTLGLRVLTPSTPSESGFGFFQKQMLLYLQEYYFPSVGLREEKIDDGELKSEIRQEWSRLSLPDQDLWKQLAKHQNTPEVGSFDSLALWAAWDFFSKNITPQEIKLLKPVFEKFVKRRLRQNTN